MSDKKAENYIQKDSIDRKIVEKDEVSGEEEIEGRDWKRMLLIVGFVIAVVILWYVIEYAAR